MLRAAESAFGTALFAKARKQKRDTSLDHRCVPFFVLSSFPANPQQFLASIAVAPQCFWAILLSQYRRRTGSGPCTRGRRLRPPKGDFVTKYLFQFARILAFCFLGEILHAVLPLPIPASVYGLILLLLALRLGIVKLEQVKEVGLFLTGIFPLLFVPAAAGVMELWAEMGNMLLPIIIAIVPVTVLVLASAGRTTQALTSRRKNKEAAHD